MTTTTTEPQGFADLEEFAKDKGSQYVKFGDTEDNVIEGMYLGYELEDDTFNPGQKRVVYLLEVDQMKKSLSSSSKRLAQAMLAAKPDAGNFIRITKTGEEYTTDYTVEVSELPF